MKRAGERSVQGDNAQVVTTVEQLVVAAELCRAANDSGRLESAIEQASTVLTAAGIKQPIGTVLADGGYWNAPQIAAIRGLPDSRTCSNRFPTGSRSA